MKKPDITVRLLVIQLVFPTNFAVGTGFSPELKEAYFLYFAHKNEKARHSCQASRDSAGLPDKLHCRDRLLA